MSSQERWLWREENEIAPKPWSLCPSSHLLQVGIQIQQARSPTSARLSRKHCCLKSKLNSSSGK